MKSAGRLGLLLLAGAGTGPAAEPPAPRLLVPAYFYPAEDGWKSWERVLDAAGRVPVVAVVNPASGPGDRADPNYQRLFERARRSEATLIGYVSTRFGKRPPAEVKADVDRWVRLYPGVGGIFFDEQAGGAEAVGYQAALYDHVRKGRRLPLVIANPGTVCAEAFFARPALDAACLFEGAKGADAYRFPDWAAWHAGRVAVLSYKVGTAEAMRGCVREAARQQFGYLYVTDAGGANPWDRLPSYWDEEVAAVHHAREGE
jgi:hypothetical protein